MTPDKFTDRVAIVAWLAFIFYILLVAAIFTEGVQLGQ